MYEYAASMQENLIYQWKKNNSWYDLVVEMIIRDKNIPDPDEGVLRSAQMIIEGFAADLTRAQAYFASRETITIIQNGASSIEKDFRDRIVRFREDHADVEKINRTVWDSTPEFHAHPIVLNPDTYNGPGILVLEPGSEMFIVLSNPGDYVRHTTHEESPIVPEGGKVRVVAIQWSAIESGGFQEKGSTEYSDYAYIIPYIAVDTGKFRGSVFPLSVNLWPVGDPSTRSIGDPRFSTKPSAFITSLLSFMSQKLSAVDTVEAPRAFRKRAERENRAINPIKVIYLRKREQRASTGPAGATPVDWKNRWIVSAHPRLQYYPALQRHKLIWIDVYVKGPESKPLKPPTKTVYAVVR